MRIIAGTYGGRQLAAPNTGTTRPMTDKVRAALFDILGPIAGWRVLDAYAGSGALGFEALSRGAASVVAVELDRTAGRLIAKNMAQLGVERQYRLQNQSVETWLLRAGAQKYDLVFAMPPYAGLRKTVLVDLAQQLAPSGIMVIEYPRQAKDYAVAGLEAIDHRSYGDPQLVFYRTERVERA